MMPWTARETFDVAVIGRRLALLLAGVTVYYVAVTIAILHFGVPGMQRVQAESLINALLLGLLMGFRNRAAYARWWEARGLWGKLVNDSRNLAVKCAAFVPRDALLASNVRAILAGFPVALRHHLRKEPCSLNALPGFEDEKDTSAHLPLYLARRLFAVLADWKRSGLVDQGELRILDWHAAGLMEVCGGCEKIRNTPLSPSYKGLLRTGLCLNVLSAPWLLVQENGWLSLPVVLLVCFFFFGVELIDSAVEEPFGTDRDDLDLDRYCVTIRDSIHECLAS